MSIEAINTIQIHATSGFASSLQAPLSRIVESLLDVPRCLSYGVTRSQQDEDVWIVSGYWQSREAMDAHFPHPALHALWGLLGCRSASRIDCQIFLLS